MSNVKKCQKWTCKNEPAKMNLQKCQKLACKNVTKFNNRFILSDRAQLSALNWSLWYAYCRKQIFFGFTSRKT
jgi:hypothetical protein